MVTSHKRHDVTVVQHGGRMMCNVVKSLKIKNDIQNLITKESVIRIVFSGVFVGYLYTKK